MVTPNNIQTANKTIELLKKGSMEIARKDAKFLQKRMDALKQEMSVMTSFLAQAPAGSEGPILRGLERLGDRLKSAGRAVENFGGGKLKQNGDAAELSSLRNALTQNYLGIADAYTSLGGGTKTRIDTSSVSAIQKLLDQKV